MIYQQNSTTCHLPKTYHIILRKTNFKVTIQPMDKHTSECNTSIVHLIE